MASPSSSSSSSLFFLAFLLIATISEGREFLVGGTTNAWKVPSPSSATLNQWAEATRFQVGDSLVWKFDAGKDSVLEVTRASYLACNTTSPISEQKEGTAVAKLDRSGPHYFISGASGACEKGEKLAVVVMSEGHRLAAGRLSPAPSPVEFNEGPAIAPTSGAERVVVGVVASVVVGLGLVVLFG